MPPGAQQINPKQLTRPLPEFVQKLKHLLRGRTTFSCHLPETTNKIEIKKTNYHSWTINKQITIVRNKRVSRYKFQELIKTSYSEKFELQS